MRHPSLFRCAVAILLLLFSPVIASTVSDTLAQQSEDHSSQITFSMGDDEGSDIYFVNVGENIPYQITHRVAGESFTEPVWSPDGSQIAFVYLEDKTGIDDIYVMNKDGSNIRRLTESVGSDRSPTWSPDGTQIAFFSGRSGSGDIYVMNADGSDQRNLTNNDYKDDFPSWSPDGTRIAFSSTLNGDGDYDIYSMDTDGGNICQITFNNGWDFHPEWSPDGSQIAFTSRSNDNIYIMNSDGTEMHQLADVGYDLLPSWTADGQAVTFMSGRDDGWNFYVVGVNEGDVRPLFGGLTLNGQLWYGAARWSRNPFLSQDREFPVSLIARVAVNNRINLRGGPGRNYPSVAGADPNQCMTILGRNEDGTWLRIRTPGNEVEIAWVSASLVTSEADLSSVPIVEE